jgi:hypothetical protein
VTITEFGTCAYKGAEKTAGMGWNVVDYDKDPEEIKGHLVRSEHTQAAYVVDLLEVFESMNLYGAMAFEFVTPDAPHRAHDPRHDLDMASYSITKTIKDPPVRPEFTLALGAEGGVPRAGPTVRASVPPLNAPHSKAPWPPAPHIPSVMISRSSPGPK